MQRQRDMDRLRRENTMLRITCALLLLGACTEYGFGSPKEELPATDTGIPDVTTPPTGPWPDLVVNPEAIDLSGVCDSGEASVWLSNMGEGDLILDLVQTTSNWGVETAVPEALAAETSVIAWSVAACAAAGAKSASARAPRRDRRRMEGMEGAC